MNKKVYVPIKETAFPYASNCPGMDLKDYFAACVVSSIDVVKHNDRFNVGLAKLAYDIADAMMAERIKRYGINEVI